MKASTARVLRGKNGMEKSSRWNFLLAKQRTWSYWWKLTGDLSYSQPVHEGMGNSTAQQTPSCPPFPSLFFVCGLLETPVVFTQGLRSCEGLPLCICLHFACPMGKGAFAGATLRCTYRVQKLCILFGRYLHRPCRYALVEWVTPWLLHNSSTKPGACLQEGILVVSLFNGTLPIAPRYDGLFVMMMMIMMKTPPQAHFPGSARQGRESRSVRPPGVAVGGGIVRQGMATQTFRGAARLRSHAAPTHSKVMLKRSRLLESLLVSAFRGG